MIDLVANDMCCEEAHVYSRDHYIPCNQPATQIIMADGRETRMCMACAIHSVKNRNMKKVRDIPADQQLAPRNHNLPPDSIDTINAAFEEIRMEAENWADGTPVENEAQMNAVDVLRKGARQWRLELEAGQKSATAPMYDAYKSELERWKPTIADAKRIEDCLVALVGGFKQKLAAEKEAARKAAWDAAEAARKEAEAKVAAAGEANIEEQREAQAALDAAADARAKASDAQKDIVRGMREVTRYEITDHRKLLNWIAKNARDDMTAFIEEWARKNHKTASADGLRVWKEKEAY